MGGRSWDPRGFVERDVVEDLVEGSCGGISGSVVEDFLGILVVSF